MGHVPHLYLPPPWRTDYLALGDEHLHHLRRVLRLSDGDRVSYTDGQGSTGVGELAGSHLRRGAERAVGRPTDVSVAVAAPASRGRTRYLVEKLAELGVERLLWMRTRHAEGRPPGPGKARAWAVSGLEQSRGAWLMQVDLAGWDELDASRLVVADPRGDSMVERANPILLVGPEGGLAPEEIPAGVATVNLGPTILRIETAAVVGAARLAPWNRLAR